jgi:hypothetical protein
MADKKNFKRTALLKMVNESFQYFPTLREIMDGI